MLRIPTTLHLPVAHIDDITRLIAICNDIYKFAAYTYSIFEEFAVDNKVMVTRGREEVARWRKDFNRTCLLYTSPSPRDS